TWTSPLAASQTSGTPSATPAIRSWTNSDRRRSPPRSWRSRKTSAPSSASGRSPTERRVRLPVRVDHLHRHQAHGDEPVVAAPVDDAHLDNGVGLADTKGRAR